MLFKLSIVYSNSCTFYVHLETTHKRNYILYNCANTRCRPVILKTPLADKVGRLHSATFFPVGLQKEKVYKRGSQSFPDLGATFTVAYGLVGRKVINYDNLLTLLQTYY
jgi:hypothetical protein